jgi:hypothetical protein
MKSQQTKRRGRKPGDGILKELNPQGSALDNISKLIFGRYGDDPIAKMVRQLWGIYAENEDLAKCAADPVKARIAAAKRGQTNGKEAVSYLQSLKQSHDRLLEKKQTNFELAARWALTRRDAGWFRKVADAIEKQQTSQACYPLHAALMMIGQLDHTVSTLNGRRVRCYSANPPLNPKARYTIDEICNFL